MTGKAEKAVSTFKGGFTCSQAVLTAFSEELGMDEKTALKVSCAFGGGMASSGMVCGAVTGSLMVLGLKHGRTTIEDLPAKDKTYALSQEFMKQFRERYGSVICKDIIGCDISTPDGKEAFRNQQKMSVCTECVRDSATILEKIL